MHNLPDGLNVYLVSLRDDRSLLLYHQLFLPLLSLAPPLECLEVLGGGVAVAQVDAEGVEAEEDQEEGEHTDAEEGQGFCQL